MLLRPTALVVGVAQYPSGCETPSCPSHGRRGLRSRHAASAPGQRDLVVFGLEAFMLFLAAIMLYRIDVGAFQKQAHEPSFVEKVALAAE